MSLGTGDRLVVYATSAHTAAHAVLDGADRVALAARRIAASSAFARPELADAAEIVFHDPVPDWFEDDPELPELGHDESLLRLQADGFAVVPACTPGESIRVECDRLHITRHGYAYWSASERYVDVVYETRAVPLDELLGDCAE